jgi:hypothetical protein
MDVGWQQATKPRGYIDRLHLLPSVDGRKRQGAADTKQATWSRSRALFGLKVDTGLDGHDQGHASQFDPAIDKEVNLISNLRWNMPVFFQIVSNMQLNSR